LALVRTDTRERARATPHTYRERESARARARERERERDLGESDFAGAFSGHLRLDRTCRGFLARIH
jgi:hypothetical protein